MVRYFVILGIIVLMSGCYQQPDTTSILTSTSTIEASSNQRITPLATTTQDILPTSIPATSIPATPVPTFPPKLTSPPGPTATNRPTPRNTPLPLDITCPILANDVEDIPSGHILFLGTRSSRYEYSNDLYVIDTDGNNLTRLTPIEEFTVSHVAVSSDGNHIAYMSKYDGNSEIYVVNIDGSGSRRVTNNNTREEWPTWYPDNTKLAYTSEGIIKVLSLSEGSTPVELTNQTITGQAWYPKWSPDGEKIAFIGNPGQSRNEIFVVNADGSDLIQLTDVKYSAVLPIWSPDSRYLIISIEEVENRSKFWQRYLIDVEKGTMSQLPYPSYSSNIFYMILGWLPDSKHIAIASNRDTETPKLDMYVASVDGTEWTRLTTDDMNYSFTDLMSNALSPEGNHIVFRALQFEGGLGLRIMKLDGTECYTIPVAVPLPLLPIKWVP